MNIHPVDFQWPVNVPLMATTEIEESHDDDFELAPDNTLLQCLPLNSFLSEFKQNTKKWVAEIRTLEKFGVKSFAFV